MPFPPKEKYRGSPLRRGPVRRLAMLSVESKKNFAERMKSAPTRLELALDSCLRAVVSGRFKIQPQRVIRGYILDSYIPELKLGFEADGKLHNKAQDAIRDGRLLKSGVRVVRFSAWQLMTQFGRVRQEISREVESAVLLKR